MTDRRIATSLVLAAMLAVAGCSTTNVVAEPTRLGQSRIAKPDRILVQDFAASAADMDPNLQPAAAAAQNAASGKALEEGRQLGRLVADRLVDEINAMGMTAVLARNAAPARVGDIVIVGHFESVDEGSAGKRVLIGFGSGKAEVKTVVQGYLMTESGLQKLGGGSVDAGGGKGPGLVVPILVTAATANPIGLVVAGAAKAEGEISGRTTAEGAAKRTADTIAERLEERFKEQGWI